MLLYNGPSHKRRNIHPAMEPKFRRWLNATNFGLDERDLRCLRRGVSDRCSCIRMGPLGGDSGGTRFSPLAQITPDNVTNLVPAWQFRAGDLDRRPADQMKRTKFEATPLLRLRAASSFAHHLTRSLQLIRAPAPRSGDTIRNSILTCALEIDTPVEVLPTGWIIECPEGPPAARGSSWARTMRA